jgi:hypothetical protein
LIDFCNKEANKVAHKLVRSAFIPHYSGHWVDEPPEFILYVLVNNVFPPLSQIRMNLLDTFSARYIHIYER